MAPEIALPREAEQPSSMASRNGLPAEDEISLLDLLVVLASRKRLIFRIAIATAAAATIISFLLPKRYTAISVILPPQQNSSLSASMASQLGALGGMAALAGGSLGLKNPNDMYVSLMKSRTVEDAMIQRFGLMQEYKERYLSDARKDFEKKAKIDGSGKDGLIRISVEDRDPNRAAELANGYVNQFRKLSESLAITEASQRRMFFEQQLGEAKDNLANAEESMKRMEQQTGLIQLDSQTRALIESAASIRAQIAAKEVQIQSLSTFATDQNAQLVQAQQELASLRRQLAKLGGDENGSDASMIVPRGRVPEAGLEYVRKLRDVKYYETIFGILARQYEMAKLDEAKQGALIQVVDSATVPDRRSSPKRTIIVLGGTLFGFMLGVFAALVSAGLQRIGEDEEKEKKLKFLYAMMSFRKIKGKVAA